MKTIGIDLGTTNSVACYFDGHREVLIEMPHGGYTLPSVVSFREGEVLVGEAALDALNKKEGDTFLNVKRVIGRAYNADEDFGVSLNLRGNEDGEVILVGDGGEWKPEEVSSEVLKVLRAEAESQLEASVKGCVISVPAQFKEPQINATKRAAKLAGFTRVEVIPEPTAAAISSGFNRDDYTRIAVFDMGGGTFDIALMDVAQGDYSVKMTNGDGQLGGINFDSALMKLCFEKYREETGLDISGKPESILRVGLASETAKKRLSFSDSTRVEINYVAFVNQMPRHMSVEVSREEFEAATKHLIDRAMMAIRQCLEDADRSPREIDQVVMVGGMSRMPAVKKAVIDIFGKKPISKQPPELAIAIGASIEAARIDGRIAPDFSFSNITAVGYGVECLEHRTAQLLPSGTPYGKARTVVLTTFEDNQAVIPVTVLQGDAPEAISNEVIARQDIRVDPAPAKKARVELTMQVDEQGVFSAIAHDVAKPETVYTIYNGADE